MEYWIGYTKNEEKTGEWVEKGMCLSEGSYRLVCEVLIYHTDGSILLLQRSPLKKKFPNFWEASVGGAAWGHETPLECIKREVFEETGCQAIGCVLVHYEICAIDQVISYSFVCVVKEEKRSLTLPPTEISAYRWVSVEEFLDFLETKEFIPTQRKRYAKYYQRLGLKLAL